MGLKTWLLVDPEKNLLLPLRIKLGVMKQFLTDLDKNGGRLKYLCETFSDLSEVKLKERIFIEPQIRKIMESIEIEMFCRKAKKKHEQL